MTKIVKFSNYGGPDVLALETETLNDPGPGEVRVRMLALALNRANTLFREGTYLYDATFPSRTGTEGVGTIESIGANVRGWEVGHRVNLLPPENESAEGYAAEYIIVPQDKLLPSPKVLNDRQAATAWIPFLTLYHFFVERQQALRGRWIVLPAASSSVGLAANSLAHHLGAKTIGITRTDEKLMALKAAGYDALVISSEDNVAESIMEITKYGADFIFDPVAGPGLTALAESVKTGGEICIYGALDPATTPLPIFTLMFNKAKVSCYTVYELMNDPVLLKQAVEYFLPLFNTGAISPVMDSHEFSLDQIVDAFQHMESNTQFGKVIVTVREQESFS